MLQVPLLKVMIDSSAALPKAYAAYVFGLIVNCFEAGSARLR